MLDDVLAIPDHLRDAIWRVESARLPRSESAGVLVCGAGTSALGGDLAAAVLGKRLARPLLTVREYALPSWTTAEWAALCVSYSGESEEALGCFGAARELGARRAVASTGGALVDAARAAGDPVIGLPGLLPAPRAAIAYALVCALEVATAAGVAPGVAEELEAAAVWLEGQREGLRARAAEIAAALDGTLPAVCGAGLTAPVAERWRAQLSANAGLPAFAAVLPDGEGNEGPHGWREGAARDAGLATVSIEDAGADPRLRDRFQRAAGAIEAAGATAVRVEVAGESRAQRLLWATMLGDLVSLELAAYPSGR